MNWYHVHLIKPQIMALSQVEILSAFQECFLNNYKPKGMWLLTDCSYAHADFHHAPELHFYFSPHTNCFCDQLINYYHGELCAEPDLTKLFAAGGDHESFWQRVEADKSFEQNA